VIIGPENGEAPETALALRVPEPRVAMNKVMVEFSGWKPEKIHPTAVISEHVIMGEGCVVGPNVTIGFDGFAFDDIENSQRRFPHIGRVVLGNRVEICANSHIARGSLKDTVLEDDVKVDSCVHIAHNCHIGRHTLITAGATIGGSVKVGEGVWIGLGAVIRDNVKIGDNAFVGMGAVVTKDIPPNETWAGVPARKFR
jgi:UDP-3-O-[3-hydroxymyristoyl] glucosamine N-acyltransferase